MICQFITCRIGAIAMLREQSFYNFKRLHSYKSSVLPAVRAREKYGNGSFHGVNT